MIPSRLSGLLPAALWLLLMAVSLATRSFLPVDETRYVSVAWEMWLRGDFLVPHLNGLPYDHKSPLLFWIIHLGWALFGVNDWWPRLTAPLFGLANLYLVALLARRLWPDRPEIARLAPLIVLGSFWWTLFTTALMFDMLVAFCALLGMLGILQARDGDNRGWLVLGLALGLGGLAKGPVILLHVLPVALLAPWWDARIRGQMREHSFRWYGFLLLATGLGFIITLAWAMPAALAGGPAYAEAIFFGQTAGRMVNSFAHRFPIWWYLPWLPVILFPWLWWPPLWQAMRAMDLRDPGARFVLAWLVPVFLAFCLISGKRAYYLLPLVPAFALLAAYALHRSLSLSKGLSLPARRLWHSWPLAAALMLTGLALLAPLFLSVLQGKLPAWLDNYPLWPGLVVMAAGALLIPRIPALQERLSVPVLALASVFLVLIFHLGLLRAAAPGQDLRAVSRHLAELQQAGVPLAHFGKYHHQFHFLGRLTQPLDVLKPDIRAAREWSAAHPDGKIIAYTIHPDLLSGAESVYPYRGGYAMLWNRAGLLDGRYWQQPEDTD